MFLIRQGTPIRKLRLSLERISTRFHDILDSIISTALLCPIQEFELCITHMYSSSYDLPPRIFTCETIVNLKLSCGWTPSPCLTLVESVSLPKLKVLHLNFRVIVDTYSIQRLIQGCPQLEELYIYFKCYRVVNHDMDHHVLDFSSPSVRNLMLDSWKGVGVNLTVIVGSNNLKSLDCRLHWDGDENGIERVVINAPNLQHLATRAPVAKLDFVADRLNSLVGTKIGALAQHVSELSRTGDDIIQHLHRVQNVESISFGMFILEALHGYLHQLPLFKKLIRLEMAFTLAEGLSTGSRRMLAWHALPHLLENTPNLEVLILHHVILHKHGEEIEPLLEAIFPKRFVENLKELGINCFESEEYEFQLVEYLLRNGKALRRFDIGEFKWPLNRARILSFNRCSTHCQIVFN